MPGTTSLRILKRGDLTAQITPQELLDRYEQGETMPQIAADLNVSHQAIYRLLLDKCPEEWKEYQAARALANLDHADEALDSAGNMVEVAKANHRVKSAQWKLERVLRRIYGQDAPPVSININLGDIGSKIARLEQELGARTIEHDV